MEDAAGGCEVIVLQLVDMRREPVSAVVRRTWNSLTRHGPKTGSFTRARGKNL